MKQAHDIGACTSLDTSDMDEHSLAGRSNWCKILEKVIPYVDIFVPSVDELCYMIDRPTFKRWEEKSNITKDLLISDVKPLAD